MDALSLVSPFVSLVGGGLAGGVVSLYFNRRFHLRSLRTELYPHLETIVKAYEIRSLLPEGKGWITDGRTFRPGPSDDEFKANRREFIARLVRWNELKEARELRRKMIASVLDATSDGFPREILETESAALGDCFTTLRKKLGLGLH